jgi:hypothetical protein
MTDTKSFFSRLPGEMSSLVVSFLDVESQLCGLGLCSKATQSWAGVGRHHFWVNKPVRIDCSDPVAWAGLTAILECSDLPHLVLTDAKNAHFNFVAQHVPGLRKLDIKVSMTEGQIMGRDCVVDSSLGFLAGLTELRRLSIECASIGDRGLSHLAKMSFLEYLEIDGCWAVTATGFRHLAGKPLRHLDFWNTSPFMSCEEAFEHLTGMPLDFLNIDGCSRINDSALQKIAGFSTLTHLHLVGVSLDHSWEPEQITDAGVAHLEGIQFISLTLNGTRLVTDEAISRLQCVHRVDFYDSDDDDDE